MADKETTNTAMTVAESIANSKNKIVRTKRKAMKARTKKFRKHKDNSSADNKRIASALEQIIEYEITADYQSYNDYDITAEAKRIRTSIQADLALEKANSTKDDKLDYEEYSRREQKTLDRYLPQTYVLIKEAIRRTQKGRTGEPIEIHDEQLAGAIALHDGCVIDQKTGEGKSLTAVLPAVLNAMSGKPVHIVTVNDYLAARDANGFSGLYEMLGLNVGVTLSEETKERKKHAYMADITYGSHAEFCLDYLRDNSKDNPNEMVQIDYQDVQKNGTIDELIEKTHSFAIVDEIDSILIDYAQTPHILTKSSEEHLIALKPGMDVKDAYKNIQGIADNIKARQQRYLTSVRAQLEQDIGEYEQIKKLLNKKKMGNNKQTARKEKAKARERIYELEDKIGRGLFLLSVASGEPDDALKRYTKAYQPLFQRISFRDNNHKHNIDFMEELTKGLLYRVDARRRTIKLSDNVEEELIVSKLVVPGENGAWNQTYEYNILINFLKARELFKEGRNYTVHDNKVMIIDEYTGRPKLKSRYVGGVHEALECIHNVDINKPTIILGEISLQRYFLMYEKNAGMSGSARPAKEEFLETYDMPLIVVPTHKKMIRVDEGYRLFVRKKGKDIAIIEDIIRNHKAGIPVLVGARDVQATEHYHKLLLAAGIKSDNIQTLTAKDALQDGFEEAKTISRAGQYGMITIATNMAGRGTDIILEERVKDPDADDWFRVIFTEIPETLRSYIQFKGRAGRQGEKGSSAIYGALEDYFFFGEVIGSAGLKRLDNYGFDKIPGIAGRTWVSAAKKKIERTEANAKKRREKVMKLDKVDTIQRETYHDMRRGVMENFDLDIYLEAYIYNIIDVLADNIAALREKSEEFENNTNVNLNKLLAYALETYRILGIDLFDLERLQAMAGMEEKEVKSYMSSNIYGLAGIVVNADMNGAGTLSVSLSDDSEEPEHLGRERLQATFQSYISLVDAVLSEHRKAMKDYLTRKFQIIHRLEEENKIEIIADERACRVSTTAQYHDLASRIEKEATSVLLSASRRGWSQFLAVMSDTRENIMWSSAGKNPFIAYNEAGFEAYQAFDSNNKRALLKSTRDIRYKLFQYAIQQDDNKGDYELSARVSENDIELAYFTRERLIKMRHGTDEEKYNSIKDMIICEETAMPYAKPCYYLAKGILTKALMESNTDFAELLERHKDNIEDGIYSKLIQEFWNADDYDSANRKLSKNSRELIDKYQEPPVKDMVV
ncbi:MAG: hypothetical protein ABIG89_00910 [Candidatus Woesearchaeota archaeon]